MMGQRSLKDIFSRRSKRSPATESLCVKIYNNDPDGEMFKVEEGFTCEQICLRIGKKCDISPTILHTFALKRYSGDHQIWLNPWEKMRMENEPSEIHFRMRFIPTRMKESNGFRNKHIDESGCLTYLFWQTYWDFHNSKITNINKKKNILIARGIVVLNVLIQMRLETEMRNINSDDLYEESLERFLSVTHKDFRDLFPLWMRMNISLDRYVLEKNMKKKVKEYQKKYPVDRFNSLALMKSFISSVLERENVLFCEEYTAYAAEFVTLPVPGKPNELTKSFNGKKELGVIVDMGQIEQQKPAVFISRTNSPRMKIPIDSLTRLDIDKDEISDLFKVQLTRVDGIPEVLYFDDRPTAESFVTCLETYYRLTVRFHQSLCPQLEPQTVKHINLVKAHGPVTESYIKQKIEKEYGNRQGDVYVLRKSLTNYDEFEVLRHMRRSQDLRISSLGKLICTEDGFSFEEGASPIKDLKKLMHDRIEEVEGLTPKNSMKIYPKTEASDVLQEIFLKPEAWKIHTEDEDDELRRQELENRPKVCMGSDVQAQKFIGMGYFTEVYQGHLNSGETVIMKRLRQEDIINCLDRQPGNSSKKLANLQAAFKESFDTLLKLSNPKYFLGFVGVSLSTPESMLIKEEKYGSLRYFLETRYKYKECQLTMHHLQGITIQLADALRYMESINCFHQNLHCSNIIVTKFVRHEMVVKIADPGMVSYYNKLGLDTVCNRNRLPWIAPELYGDLQMTSVRSEIYAYGMTLWQMYNEGQSPRHHPCLMNKTVQEMREFFSNPEFQLPCPLYLRPSDDDPVLIKRTKKDTFETIQKCCNANQQERPTADDVLRNLHGTIFEFGQDYHDYNIIYDKDSTMSYNIRSSGSTLNSGGGTGETSGVNSNSHHIPVPIHDMMKVTENHPNENAIPKTVIDADGSQSRTSISQSMIEPNPGSPSKPGAGHIQQPPVNQTPASRGARGLSPGPIVSDVKFIIKEGRLSIDFETVLGSGYYGKIHKGTLEPSSSAGIMTKINVAVKALKDDQVERFHEEFKKEASIMELLEHPNIVKFYGIYKDGKYMVMELVERGSLHQFVQSCRKESKPISKEKMLQISIDITGGMEYLASKGIIHCDLAARNVLLNNDLRAKVSDFGLSKVLRQDKDYYRRTEHRTIPILWCAPEWIGFKRFFPKSDVWSFGVVLWEIYSFGRTPLIGTETDLNKFYQNLYEGQRLGQPKLCPNEIYSLMKSCWSWNPDDRLTFTQIKGRLENIMGGMRLSKPQTTAQTTPTNSITKSQDTDKTNLKVVDGDETNVKIIDADETKLKIVDADETNAKVVDSPNSPNSDSGTAEGPFLDRVSDPSRQSHQSQKSNLDGHTDHAPALDQLSDPGLQDLQGSGDTATSACPYRQANEDAGFVELPDTFGRSGSNDAPVIGRIPTDASKTEPVHGVHARPIVNGDSTFHGMTQKKMSRSAASLIEGELTVFRQDALGNGRFGKVYRGTHNGNMVAIKTCTDEVFRDRFQREYEILKTLQHPNIVHFIGVHCPSQNRPGLEYVMEYMGKGSLWSNLQKAKKQNNPLSVDMKVKFLIQIAEGMEYLFSCYVCHGDLKTDNVLVNDENIAKLSDFGLAKLFDDQEGEDNYKRNGGLLKPYIWLEKSSWEKEKLLAQAAPETLHKQSYSRYTDIWSYGVACLEVFLDGEQSNFTEPLNFQHVTNTGDCVKLFQKLRSGERFQKPADCPESLYDVIVQCWSWNPKDRVHYGKIIEVFRSFLESRPPAFLN